jgi:hypothetical protein
MSESSMDKQQLVTFGMDCRGEAEDAKQERMKRNKDNYDMFHLRHDFSHKKEGQSMEILSKQSMAVEQTKANFQQALADLSDWWDCEARYPDSEHTLLVRESEITQLTNFMLEKARYYSHVGNCVESALLASLAISKTGGRLVPKPKFIARKAGRGKGLKRWVEKIDDKSWEITFQVIRAENYYPDPTGKGLYEIEDSWVDYHELLAMAEDDEDFDKELLKGLCGSGGVDESEENFSRARETGQNTASGPRLKVKLTEFWGSIVHPTSGEIVFENVQMIIANDSKLILPPRPNPLWHQRSPYTVSPLLEVANSVWHKALMDAPTQHNRALIEMYNLMVDAAMMQVHGISQIRKNWLDNPAQVADGVRPGMALGINAMCPPGAKVLEPLVNVQIPTEAFNVFNIQGQEFFSSALSSDLRSGMTPSREQKATAIVEQSQTITSVSTGMAKNYEGRQSVKELELAWMTTAQNWDLIDREVFVSLFGSARGAELADLPPEEVFANTVGGIKFRVFGITQTLGKTQEFQKLTTLLQTIAASPVLMEEYTKKYSMTKTLGEIMSALDIDKYKLEIPVAEQRTMEAPPEGAPEPQPDQMSQVAPASGIQEMTPEAAGVNGGPQISQTQFPGSPAIPGGN